MVSSKNLFLVVALLVSLALLLSSQAAASEKSTKTDAVEEQEVADRRCRYGCCRFYKHRCVRCCPSAEEDSVAESKENVEQLHGCRSGRCCSWFRGTCVRCCRSADEASHAEVKN